MALDWDKSKKVFNQYLQRTATIHIYSFPHFMLETFTTSVILLIYLYLYGELWTINKKIRRLKPNTIYFDSRMETGQTLGGSASNCSIRTSVTRYREIYKLHRKPSNYVPYKGAMKNFSTNSQWGWVMPTNPENNNLDKCCYAEQLVALTPEQFVKIDIERKQREKELESYMASLSTLCKNVLCKKYSEKTLTRQVDMAKESLQCNKMSLEGKYLGFKTDAMTKSLFNMLEDMITKSSLQNPLPFKGDITTLALDAADLSIVDEPYYTRDVTQWDAHSSSIISNSTDDNDDVSTFKEGNWEKDNNVKVNWKKLQ